MTAARRTSPGRTRLRLVELEVRYAPAVFDVTFHGPAAGAAGETAATHTGGLALTGGAPQGADTARVTAATAADAVAAVLSGSVTAALDGKATTYPFGPTTASGNRADHKPYFVFLPDGRTGFVRLEDMAGSPNTADWDYNDRGWRVGVRPVGGLTVGGPQPQGGDPTGGDPPYPPPNSAVLWDMFDQKATVVWDITYPSEGKMHWKYTVTNYGLHNVTLNTNKGMTSFTVGGQPAGFRNTDTSLTPWHRDPASPAWNWPGTGGLMPPGVGVFEFDTDTQPAEMVEAGAGGTGRYMTLALGMVMGPAAPPEVSIDLPKLIPVNANNDNSKGKPDAQRWKPNTSKTIPLVRDFDAATIPEADPQLLQTTLGVTGKLGGTLTVTSEGGTGRVRFFEDPKKEKAFTSVAVPAGADFTKVIYVEGTKESEAADEIAVKATFTTDGAVPTSKTAEKRTAVAPIIMDYKARAMTAIPTPFRDWARGGQVAGMAAGRQAQNGGRGSEREGMRFTADLISGGFAVGKFVQVVTAVGNGNPSSFQLSNGHRYDFRLPNPHAFPLNDSETDAQVPYYKIIERPTPPAPADGREVFVAIDSPGFAIVFAGPVLTRMDMTFAAKTYVVWTYSDGSLYSLAWAKWDILFAGDLQANAFQPRATAVVNDAKTYTRDNSDPVKLNVPAFNPLIPLGYIRK